jgi:lipopolysaccharide biosynthesis glycosyltransferase
MKFALTTTLDDRYIEGFLITFNSILESSKNFNYDVIIFEWGQISESNKILINKLYNKFIFKTIDIDLYKKHCFDDKFRKWTYNCNYRFDIFTLEEYDKIIYFDSDMLFQIDVAELFEKDVDFGGVQMPTYHEYAQVVGNRIFNAGMMLIGKKFLNKNTREELIKIVNSKPPINDSCDSDKWIGNQPILNCYFLDKMSWLPQKYNHLSEDITLDSFKKKRIYHFIGKKKPWAADEKERFDKYILNQIAKNTSHIILNRMIYKRIEEMYNEQLNCLLKKGIDIKLLETPLD